MFKKLLYLAAVAVVILQSCALKQQHVLFEQRTTPLTDSSSMKAAGPYRIKYDDILQIRNLQNLKYITDGGTSTTNGGGNEAGSGQSFQVEEDGTITVPALGHVSVAGLTRYEAAKKIEKLYRDSLLKNPIIELKITNLKVTMMGEVQSPGNYPLLKEHTTLIDLLGAAGGLTKSANEKNIKIIRGDKEHQQVMYVDLGDIRVLNDPRLVLQNNDIVYIAQNKRAIRDEKLQNFSTVVQPSLLIFNTALIIYTLFR